MINTKYTKNISILADTILISGCFFFCAANPIFNPIPHHLHIAEHMSPASRRNGSSPPSGPLPPRSVHSPNSSG